MFLFRFPLTPPKKNPSLKKDRPNKRGQERFVCSTESETFNAWLSGQSIRPGDPSPSMLMFLAHPVDVLSQVPKAKLLQMSVS